MLLSRDPFGCRLGGFASGLIGQKLVILILGDRLAGECSLQHPVIPQTAEVVGPDVLIRRHSHNEYLHIGDEKSSDYIYVGL